MSWLPDWLTGYDPENARRAAAADATRQQLDDRAYVEDRITNDEWNRRRDVGYGVDLDQQRAEIDETFGQAVKDNASALSQGINDTLSFTVSKILGAIPWWLWLASLFGLFLYLGGGAVLRKQISKLA